MRACGPARAQWVWQEGVSPLLRVLCPECGTLEHGMAVSLAVAAAAVPRGR